MVPHQWPEVPDVIWHIYSHLHCSTGDGGRELTSSGEAAPTMGQVPVCSEQIQFFRGSQVKGHSSLALLRMCLNNGQWLWLWFGTFTHAWPAPRRIVLGMYNLQGRWFLVTGKSPVSFKQIGLGSVFRGIWAKGLSSPAPQDSQGWYTVSSSRCNLAHLLAPVLLPCEFWADQPGFSFSGEEPRQGSFQPCPSKDGASSMAGSSGHDLAHLLEPVLLLKGWW